jgi:Domain of unknown function (DUF305)
MTSRDRHLHRESSMPDNATLKLETGPSARGRNVWARLSSQGSAPRSPRQLIADVSRRTRTRLAPLAAAALIGAATSLGALWMAAGPDKANFLAAYVYSLCRPFLGAPSREEEPFLAENQAAMMTMMNGMDIRPTGDVDRDFVDMMVPHHQGAIDMAQAILRYGRNEKIRRLAQEIIVTQQQEITAMRLAVNKPLPPSIPASTALRAAKGN